MKRQSASVDCDEINLANFSISAVFLSAVATIMQISGTQGISGPLGSSMSYRSVISVCSAHIREARDAVRTGTSSLKCFCPQF